MKKALLILGSLLTIFISCRKDEPIIKNINCYSYYYMDYPISLVLPDTCHGKVSLIYSHANIIKRIGGLTPVSQASGYDYKYSTNICDELTYIDNSVSIVTKITIEGDTWVEKERVIYFDNDKKMILKVAPNVYNLFDTTYYSYNPNGLLTESKIRMGGELIQSSYYYYNSLRNLDSIVTIDNDGEYKKVEMFSDYDSALNPLKQLIIFEETFHRALCTNNYRKYSMKEYFLDEGDVGTANINWTLYYDADGIPTFYD